MHAAFLFCRLHEFQLYGCDLVWPVDQRKSPDYWNRYGLRATKDLSFQGFLSSVMHDIHGSLSRFDFSKDFFICKMVQVHETFLPLRYIIKVQINAALPLILSHKNVLANCDLLM